MKFIYSAFVLVFLSSCGATVNVDYEKGLDWTVLKSYQFYTEMNSGLNNLDDTRIKKVIDSTLQKKTFQKTNYNQYYVSFFVEESLSNSRKTIGIGLGSGGGGISVGGGVGIPIGGKVINQRITIEFRKATTGEKLIWQAVYDGELKEKATPKQKEAYYDKVIPMMLKDFPPKENKK